MPTISIKRRSNARQGRSLCGAGGQALSTFRQEIGHVQAQDLPHPLFRNAPHTPPVKARSTQDAIRQAERLYLDTPRHAAFIVQACNARDGLVAILKLALQVLHTARRFRAGTDSYTR